MANQEGYPSPPDYRDPVSYTHLAKVKAPVIVQFSNGGASFIAGKGVKSDVPQGAAILGAISGAPVSYTHLDVYKRQVQAASAHSVKDVKGCI